MIRTLRVRNLAVIEDLQLELGPGLNVLTGETGAGKSVLVGAITALAGRRVSSDAVRTGAASASVEALFESETLARRAAELGLGDPDASELLVSRELAREGRSRVFVNGRLATLALLGELLGDAVEIVSQAEHQQLLRGEVQAGLLDAYAGLGPLAQRLRAQHESWVSILREIQERRAHAEERAREEDRLRFEIEQIEAIDLRPGELEELEREHARLAHVERLGSDIEEAQQRLEGDDGARERLARALGRLRSAAALDASLDDAVEALARAQLELEDASARLDSYQASLEADPARLASVEERVQQIGRLQARYGATPGEILAYCAQARARLEQIGGGELRTSELEGEQHALAQELERAARELGAGRRSAAQALERAMREELAALELGGARFEVAFEPLAAKTREGFAAPCAPQGLERASFLLSANPGEELRALREVASGGELARLLLALRNVLREADAGRVLLFDEVDAGVGGRTAQRVGERLRTLAGAHQVLCITHLPQIAALADTHYCVEKRRSGTRTVTLITLLADVLRVEEIARMASGGRVTDVARAHARELLAR